MFWAHTVDPMRLDWIRQMRFGSFGSKIFHQCTAPNASLLLNTYRQRDYNNKSNIFTEYIATRGRRSGKRQLDKCMLKFQLAI